jgi:DNA-binding ferritin-like protein (Dps family)
MGIMEPYNEPPYEEEPEPELHVDLKFTVGDLDSVVHSIVHNVSEYLSKTMSQDMKKEVTAIVKQNLKQEADDLVERVANDMVRPTDRFGDPIGDPISLKAMFEKHVQDYLNEKVGSDGKAPRYGEKGRPRLEVYIESIIKTEVAAFMKDLKTEVSEDIRKQYDEKLRAEMSKLLNNMMTLPSK